MSFRVDPITKVITITRGDSGVVDVGMRNKDDGSPYTPQQGDVVRFALKSAKMRAGNTDFVDVRPLVRKVIPNSTLELEFVPSDTKNLPFGTYKYDVEITMADGYVDTFIENADFIITEEVD